MLASKDAMPEACENGSIEPFDLSVGLREVRRCCPVFETQVSASKREEIAYKFRSVVSH